MGKSSSKKGTGGVPCLNEGEIDELLETTKFKKKELKKWYRDFIKDYPNGNLNKEQFNNLYNKLYALDGDNQEKTDHIFRSFDHNNDNQVSFKELMSTLSVLRRGPIREKMEFLFEIYDIDGNGFITKEELADVVNSMQDISAGYKHSAARMTALFPEVDSNNDGYLTVDEFIQGVESNPQLRSLLNTGQVLPLV